MAKPKILMFKAAGCPMCADVLPYVQKLSAHYASCVDTEIHDVDDAEALAEQYGVEAVPDLVSLGPNGERLFRLVGYVDTMKRCERLYLAVARTAATCDVPILSPER